MRRSLFATLLATSALVAPSLASAEGPLEPLGIRAGAFLVYPRVNTSLAYDTNVYAEPDNENSDVLLIVRPEVDVRSQWSRHSLSASAFAEGGFYSDETDANWLDFGLGLAGVVDISSAQALRLDVSAARLHEDAGDPDAVGSSDVTKYLALTGNIAYRYQFNRFFVQPSVGASRSDFEDVPGFNNDDRDHNLYQLALRGGVAVSPAIRVFGEGFWRRSDYDQTPDDAGVDRESKTYGVRVGTELEFSRLLTGDAAIGVARNKPDDSALDDTTGFNAVVGLTWTPTPLTTVDLNALADMQETTVTFKGETASTRFRKQIGVNVTHAVRQNVSVSGRAFYIRDDFQGTDRSDDVYGLGLGVNYTVNRWLVLGTSWDFQKRSSDDDTAEYTRHRVLATVTVRR